MKNKRLTGKFYEKLAGEYLKTLGYEIITYNYRCRSGEVDIIAKEGGCLVFCEVKYRTDGRKGMPLEAVGPKKQRRISGCALYYVAQHHLSYLQCRFDVVGILGNKISLVKNAFEFQR